MSRILKFHQARWLWRRWGKEQQYETNTHELESCQQVLQEFVFVPRKPSKHQTHFSAQTLPLPSPSCSSFAARKKRILDGFIPPEFISPAHRKLREWVRCWIPGFSISKPWWVQLGHSLFEYEKYSRESRERRRGGSCSAREVPAQLLLVTALRSPSALPVAPARSDSLPANSQHCKAKSRALSEKGNPSFSSISRYSQGYPPPGITNARGRSPWQPHPQLITLTRPRSRGLKWVNKEISTLSLQKLSPNKDAPNHFSVLRFIQHRREGMNQMNLQLTSRISCRCDVC